MFFLPPPLRAPLRANAVHYGLTPYVTGSRPPLRRRSVGSEKHFFCFFPSDFFFWKKENNGEKSSKKTQTSLTGSTGSAVHKTPVNGHDASEGQLSRDEWSHVCVRGGGAVPAHSPRSGLLGTYSAGPHAESDRAPFPLPETYSRTGAVRSFLAVARQRPRAPPPPRRATSVGSKPKTAPPSPACGRRPRIARRRSSTPTSSATTARCPRTSA